MRGSPPDPTGIRRRAYAPRSCRSEWERQIHPDPHERVQGDRNHRPRRHCAQHHFRRPSTGGAREALRRRRDALAAGRSHLVETTLAGSGVLRHMTAARRKGYRIVLHYVSVSSPDQALDRIRNRVALGGDEVTEADVRRRFMRSHANLLVAMARADLTVLYDNTDPDRPHREVAILGDGTRWIAATVPGWATAALARS